MIQTPVLNLLALLTFTQEGKTYLTSKLADFRPNWLKEREKHIEAA
jgi:hypothetical protein